MIDLEFIERLIQVFDGSGVDSLEIERGGTRVKMSKTPPSAAPLVLAGGGEGRAAQATVPPPTAAPTEPAPRPVAERSASPSARELIEVTSPMVGTFYRASNPNAPPFAQPGDVVKKGQVLCIIEAMKLMNEIESEVSGEVVDIPVSNGQPVEYGEVLFRIRALSA